MKSAADAPFETGPVKEDAGVISEAGRAAAALFLFGHKPAIALGLGMELPLVWTQPLDRPFDLGDVVFIDHVGAVAAAALLEVRGIPGHDALTSAAENARPRRQEEGDIENPGAILSGIFEGQILVEVIWSGHGH